MAELSWPLTILWPSFDHPLTILWPSFDHPLTILWPSFDHPLTILWPSFRRWKLLRQNYEESINGVHLSVCVCVYMCVCVSVYVCVCVGGGVCVSARARVYVCVRAYAIKYSTIKTDLSNTNISPCTAPVVELLMLFYYHSTVSDLLRLESMRVKIASK